MILWDSLVDLLRLFITSQVQLCGGNLGLGITFASFIFRVALLPLTSRLAKATFVQQQTVAKLKPEIDAIHQKFAKRPQQRLAATRELFEKHGVNQPSLAGCLGMLFQMPLLVAFYTAVRQAAAVGGRFLWIRNIAKPDLGLSAIVAGLTFVSLWLSRVPTATPETSRLMLVLPVVVMAVVLLKTSAGVALYFGVSSIVRTAENYWIQRNAVTAV